MKLLSLLPPLAALLLSAAPPTALAQRASACYFERPSQPLGTGQTGRCTYRHRRNSNGDPVTDVVWFDNVRATYIFWASGLAEILTDDKRYFGRWKSYDGVTIIIHDNNVVTGLPFPVR